MYTLYSWELSQNENGAWCRRLHSLCRYIFRDIFTHIYSVDRDYDGSQCITQQHGSAPLATGAGIVGHKYLSNIGETFLTIVQCIYIQMTFMYVHITGSDLLVNMSGIPPGILHIYLCVILKKTIQPITWLPIPEWIRCIRTCTSLQPI